MTTRRNFSHPAAVMSQEHNEDQAFEAGGVHRGFPGEEVGGWALFPTGSTWKCWARCEGGRLASSYGHVSVAAA